MEKATVTLKVKALYVLKQIIDTFLTKEVEEDNQKKKVDRDLPFRLRYRLERNLIPIESMLNQVEEAKLQGLAQLGTLTEDGKNVELKDEGAKKKYFEKVSNLLETPISLSIVKCEDSDLDAIQDIGGEFTNDMIKILIAYLINDKELLNDLQNSIEMQYKENKSNEQ